MAAVVAAAVPRVFWEASERRRRLCALARRPALPVVAAHLGAVGRVGARTGLGFARVADTRLSASVACTLFPALVGLASALHRGCALGARRVALLAADGGTVKRVPPFRTRCLRRAPPFLARIGLAAFRMAGFARWSVDAAIAVGAAA
jgi:hypothetical protein